MPVVRLPILTEVNLFVFAYKMSNLGSATEYGCVSAYYRMTFQGQIIRGYIQFWWHV